MRINTKIVLSAFLLIAIALVWLGASSAGISITGPTAIRTITVPDADCTMARTDAGQTFTGVSTCTSWSLVTPALGTPASGNLANCTGYPTSGGGNAIYGSGVDSALAFDGVANPVAGATLASTTYTLQRDIYASSITISNGITIATNNYRIFCTGNVGMVSGSGTIDNSGPAGAATGAGGAAGTSATLSVGNNQGGGAGGTAGGTTVNNNSNSVGGSGGNGGSGSGGAGGSGGTCSVPSAGNGGSQVFSCFINALTGKTAALGSTVVPGCGGGGGGGDGASGAGGGAAGGLIMIAAKTFSGTITISANGGKGGDASLGTNTGGGGGGGGGSITIITSTSLPGGITLSVAAGAKGNKKAGGTGNDGVAGSAGTTTTIIN